MEVESSLWLKVASEHLIPVEIRLGKEVNVGLFRGTCTKGLSVRLIFARLTYSVSFDGPAQ